MKFSNTLSRVAAACFALGSLPLATAQYAIIDQDWSSQAYIPILLIADAGIEILGLTAVTGDTWMTQASLHALALLEIGNFTDIPVVTGATFPLINTALRWTAWQQIWGTIVWEGAFAANNGPSNTSDPQGGDPFAIIPGAFIEGYPNTTVANDTTAAWFMVQQVRKYPGQVSIYAAGAFTNVALACRLDPEFAALAKELVIMGGYIDEDKAQIYSAGQSDLYGDFNLYFDPEASKIMLNAPWRNVTIAGNVANLYYGTQNFTDEVAEVVNPYTVLFESYDIGFPFWDETAAVILAHPDIVTSSYQAYIDVDIGFASPFNGRAFIWGNSTAPAETREVTIVNSIDQDAFFEYMKTSMQKSRP